MDTIGERIKKFAKEKFGSVSSLARAMGIKETSLSTYINGRSKPGASIQEKLRNVGANVEWIMTGNNPALERLQSTYEGIKDASNPSYVAGYIAGREADKSESAWSGLGLTIIGVRETPEGLKVPMMLTPASCGDPSDTTDDVAFYFEPGKLYSTDHTFFVEAKGESMTGVLNIVEGDWLLVNIEKLPTNGCVVLARVNDGAVVKRLRKNGQDILLTPDNPNFNPIIVNDKNARILGVITEIKRML